MLNIKKRKNIFKNQNKIILEYFYIRFCSLKQPGPTGQTPQVPQSGKSKKERKKEFRVLEEKGMIHQDINVEFKSLICPS